MQPTTVPAPPLDLVHEAAALLADRPWLAGIVAAAILAGVTIRSVVQHRRHCRLTDGGQQITVTPPAEVDPAGAATWWANLQELLAPAPSRRLLHGVPHVAVEYRWTGRQLTIVVWLPGTIPAAPIAAAARAAWPGAATTITDATPPIPATAHATGGTLAPALPAWYPLAVDHKTDPTRALIAAGGELRTGEHACVQILTRPATPRQSAALRRNAAALRTRQPTGGLFDPTGLLRGMLSLITEIVTELVTPGPPRRVTTTAGRATAADPVRDRDARPALDNSLRPQWETAIRYAVATTKPGRPEAARKRIRALAHAIASAFGVYTERNRLHRRRLATPVAVLAARRFTRGFLLSVDELAVIAALPVDLSVPGLDRARARAIPAPVALPTGGRGTKVLGRAEVGGHSVAVPIVDARQHIHVLGSTGSGKSTQLCHMIMDDVRARRGVVVIDPKGDLALDILDRIPASMADRVVLIDPDQPGGATLNPLAGSSANPDHDLVVDNVVAIFSKIFQRHWGPRIDDVLRVACLTLMRKANATLTLVPPLLNDKQFRARFTADLDDPEGLLGFWEWYEATPPPLRAQVIGPVLARLRAFLLRDFVRQTLGVPKSSFDMGRVLDGGILIARLPKGQLGEETAKLMGSFVFASVWQAATARARLPEPERRDAVCYIDEAHNVLNLAGSVTDMLAEARGYHLSLVLAHQNLTQLPRDTQLALSANARNKIYFACSPEDANQLARHTEPELDGHDLAHLDAYTAATRLVVGSRQTAAFTMRTRPPLPVVGEALALRQAIEQSGPRQLTGIEHLARRRTVQGRHGAVPATGKGLSR